MRNIGSFPILLTLMALLVFSACATVGSNGITSSVPLPTDLEIVPPDFSVPAEYAGFSGKWVGSWDQTVDHILVVEEIRGNTAVVIYAWGHASSRFIDPGWTRVKGEFKDGKLILNLPNGAIVTYHLKNGVLAGEYERVRYFSRATMKHSE